MTRRSDPAPNFKAITSSDTVFMTFQCTAIYVGGAGDVTCLNEDGEAITFANVAAGSILPVTTQRVNATGTSATDLVALAH